MNFTAEQVVDILRWAAAVFALRACIYATRFVWRYRKVQWEASPWGRHVMRFSILIAVAMGTAVVIRVLALVGLDNPVVLALIAVTIYWWVSYEMKRRYFLERETQAAAAKAKAEAAKKDEEQT